MPPEPARRRLARLLLTRVLLSRVLPAMAVAIVGLTACSATTGGAGQGAGSGHPKAPALRQLWQHAVGGEPGTEQQLIGGSADAKRVYVSDVSGHVFALDARTGALAWTRKPGERTGASVALVGNRALLYDTDLGVFALDSATGSPVWSKKVFSLPSGHAFVPAAASGIVGLFTSDAFVGLRLSNGTSAWSIPQTKTRFTLDNPASNGKLIFALTTPSGPGARVLALRPTTGATQWAAALPAASGAAGTRSALYAFGALVLVVSAEIGADSAATLLAFDAAAGKPRWTVTVAGPNPAAAPPIVVGDELLFPTRNGIQALALSTGRALFTTAMDFGGATSRVGRCGAARRRAPSA